MDDPGRSALCVTKTDALSDMEHGVAKSEKDSILLNNLIEGHHYLFITWATFLLI